MANTLPTSSHIAARILVIRGHKVMVDSDLAELYGVPTRRLNEQVRRNAARFPADFIFQLSDQEVTNLKSQFATSSWGGRRKTPLVFTEHGALMAATVLNSPRAIEMSVYVVRAFVQLREALSAHKELAAKLDQLEHKFATHDQTIAEIITIIRELMKPAAPAQKRPIGFVAPKND